MRHERPYQTLIVWKEAHQLCLRIYMLGAKFPGYEKFRLMDQLCRAAASVPTNIAEGSGKKSKKERFRFYEIAGCSLEETHYHLLLAKDLRYIDQEIFDQMDDHIQRVSYLLVRLRGSLG